MKTIEEQIKEIKHDAECVIYNMKDHKAVWIPDNGSLDASINAMHIAQTKEKLSEAYNMYINACIHNSYPYAEIIGGIMQNKEQNEKFNVDIEAVIESLIQITSPVKMTKVTNVVGSVVESIKSKVEDTKTSDPVVNPANSNKNNSAGGIDIDEKIANKIRKKMAYTKGLADKITTNQSSDPISDADKASNICDEIIKLIVSINPEKCSKEEIDELNNSTALINEMKKYFEATKTFYKYKTIESNKKDLSKPVEEKINDTVNQTVEYAQQTTPVQQTVAAHTENGFNIANFVKQAPVKGPNMPTTNNSGQPNKSGVFPHQICGLTDEQIVDEVGKHFKVLEPLPAYALYDLLHNKLLAKKMKELNSKQRTNNPFLTQVNINNYIDVPELLQKYNLCFTIPCNDKSQIIVILFNTTPVFNNGVSQYPLHIFKASKINNK